MMNYFHYSYQCDLHEQVLKFELATDVFRNKPYNGFWASHEDAWPRFLHVYEYGDEFDTTHRYRVDVFPECRFLDITPKWHKRLPSQYIDESGTYGLYLDYPEIAKDYDAVRLFVNSERWGKRRDYFSDRFDKWNLPSTVFLRQAFQLVKEY